jgi:ESCRT-I complex subunit VPS28
MDAIKIDYKSCDQLHPILLNIVDGLNKAGFLNNNNNDFEKLKNWNFKFNNMKATDELNENEIRQYLFDLESSYNKFHSLL